jgi:hypothetical protein
MKDGGYSPEWVELRQKLDSDVAELRTIVRGRLEWLLRNRNVTTTEHCDVVLLAAPEVRAAVEKVAR